MKIFRKLKNKSGSTLVEVILVVSLMTIMLGIAVPNILAESQKIKLATMDGYARSVAVAVQSKLYGMKNSGTSIDSEYWTLNETAAKEVNITTDEGEKPVKYITNFGEKGEVGKMLLLSGALTDTELMQSGKIVVVYDPDTANVLETYYSENEFDIKTLFPTVNESFLKEHLIGSYLGYGAPEPQRKVRVPNFSCQFIFDDELYLQMQMIEEPSETLRNKKLALEIYAEIPGADGTTDEVGIYYQGFFYTTYHTDYAKDIESDTEYPLTVDTIKANGGYIRFALDSLITESAAYGKVKDYLRHQNKPGYTTVTDPLLYPRETIANWFNPQINPYITVWHRENSLEGENKCAESATLHQKIFGGASVTEYVPVDRAMRLRIKLSVLSDTDTRDAKDTAGAKFYTKDENFAPFETWTDEVSPYFTALTQETDTITLSAMRDLGNLKYVFTTHNSITRAELNKDITGQQSYDKLMRVRYALFDKSKSDKTVMDSWSVYANTDTLTFDAINQTKPFTLSGENKTTGGRFAIVGVGLGSRANLMGGLFPYASDLTVEHLDIIDCWVQRNGFKNDFLTMDNGTITGINATYQNAISGTLVGMAVNCRFDDVHVYIDKDRQLQVESFENTLEGYHNNTNTMTTNDFGYLRTSGVVAGGLVGIAIGSNSITTQTSGSSVSSDSPSATKHTSTTFVNCSASTNVGAELYDQTSKCLYSGGLVGVTMGDVKIENSFAACQLGGYYAGGLVGGVAKPGDWNFNNMKQYGVPDMGGTKYYNENGKSKDEQLTITGSFSSGIILRQVRVGGGLIADIGSTAPSVTDCYSSVKWQILPPTAYGTFKGDEKNYFIAQTYFAVPVTTNIEAHFRCEGDVFSLCGNGQKSGIACANAADLKDKLKDTKWSSAAATHYWQREVGDRYDQKDAEGHSYPFPMRTGNNVFSGPWIMDTKIDDPEGSPAVSFYDKASQEGVPKTFKSTFEGLFCAYYDATWANLRQRNVDAGIIYAKEFSQANGEVLLDGQKLTENWWMRNSTFEIPYVGLTTDVSYENGVYQFTGYAYNDPLFDPVKQDTYKSKFKGDAFILHTDTTFNWDYFGFYFGDMAEDAGWGGMPDDTSYYIKFDENVSRDTAMRDIGTNKCRVNPNNFSQKKTFSLSEKDAQIKWTDKDGFFCVTNGDAA